MALGFTFNNTHSGTMGVVFRSVDRTLLPAKRVTQYTIPGKSGTYDIADGYQTGKSLARSLSLARATNIPESVHGRGPSLGGSPARACSCLTTSPRKHTPRK